MRTTIDIDDRLRAAARRCAAEDSMTLTAFVEHSLAGAVGRAVVLAVERPHRR